MCPATTLRNATPDRADMRAHDEVCVFRRDNVGRRPRHVVDIAAGVVERDFNLAAKNAAAAVDLGNAQQRAVDGGRAPDSDGPDSPTKLAMRNFLRSRRSRNRRERWHRSSPN